MDARAGRAARRLHGRLHDRGDRRHLAQEPVAARRGRSEQRPGNPACSSARKPKPANFAGKRRRSAPRCSRPRKRRRASITKLGPLTGQAQPLTRHRKRRMDRRQPAGARRRRRRVRLHALLRRRRSQDHRQLVRRARQLAAARSANTRFGARFGRDAGYRSFAFEGPGYGTRIVTNPLHPGRRRHDEHGQLPELRRHQLHVDARRRSRQRARRRLLYADRRLAGRPGADHDHPAAGAAGGLAGLRTRAVHGGGARARERTRATSARRRWRSAPTASSRATRPDMAGNASSCRPAAARSARRRCAPSHGRNPAARLPSATSARCGSGARKPGCGRRTPRRRSTASRATSTGSPSTRVTRGSAMPSVRAACCSRTARAGRRKKNCRAASRKPTSRSVAFAGSEAMVAAEHDLLVNEGSGWKVEPEVHALLASLPSVPSAERRRGSAEWRRGARWARRRARARQRGSSVALLRTADRQRDGGRGRAAARRLASAGAAVGRSRLSPIRRRSSCHRSTRTRRLP